MKVYLAGGMKSGWQDVVRREVEHHTYYDPRDHALTNWRHYSAWDLGMIVQCDWVFGYFEKDNPSGYGLCAEIGYGKGLGKQIILVDEISGVSELHSRHLRIVEALADAWFYDFDEGIDFLARLP